MANDLNSVLKMPVAQPQVQGLTQMNAQTRAGNGKSFASVMSEIGSNAQAAQTLDIPAELLRDQGNAVRFAFEGKEITFLPLFPFLSAVSHYQPFSYQPMP